MKQQRIKGSITVFLSLLLPLMLALTGTLLEAARVRSARDFLTECNAESMQMMFSDYNKELWEDYHLFAYTGEDKEAEEEINRAVAAALGQEEAAEGIWQKKNLNFWHIKSLGLSLESKETMVDEDGGILKHEVVEFMKYQIAEDAVREILKLFGIMKETGAAAKVSQKKLETEEKLYDYSREMLDFMEVLDGIDFGKDGVQYIGGKIKGKAPFVKQFFYGKPDKAAAGIENEVVWESLKDSYYDSKAGLESLEELLKEMQEAVQEYESGQNRVAELEEELERLKEDAEQLAMAISEGKEEKEEGLRHGAQNEKEKYQKQLSENNERQIQIENDINGIYKKIKKAESIKEEFLSSWQKKSSRIAEKTDEIRTCAEKALGMIPKLKELQEAVAVSVKEYQKVIQQEETELSSEMYKSFSDDCEQLAASVGIKNGEQKKVVCDLDAFQRYLQQNISILQSIKSGIFLYEKDFQSEMFVQKETELLEAKRQAENYHVSEFMFSYKIVEQKKRENPMETLRKLGNASLLSLVIKDDEKISKSTIEQEEKVFPEEKEEGFLENISDKMTEVSAENSGVFSSIFGEFSSAVFENIKASDSVENIGQELLQELFLNGYVQKVFFDYPTEKKNEKMSVLRYEQEYILAGNNLDKDNLASAVKRVTAVRTVCNYMSLLSDSVRQKEAYAAAVAIAGFTGLEPLTEILKSTILLVWAYEEAVVDTAALLQGKTLPVIKVPSQIALSFQELFTFGRAMVQKKAKMALEIKAGCGYSEYLYLFFCMQKQKATLYRMADMIQMNMKQRYDEKFSLNRAVFGCRLKGNYYVPTAFFQLPFTGWIGDRKTDGWNVQIISEKAY